MLFLGMSPVYVLSDEESAALSREEEPLTWRFVLCSAMACVTLVTALAFFRASLRVARPGGRRH